MKYTHRRGCGVVTAITDWELRAMLAGDDATPIDRERGAKVLALEVGEDFTFTSERDGMTVKFRRVE